MKLKISLQDRNFFTKGIANGEIIKEFFFDLSKNIFSHSYQYSIKHKELTGNQELPLLYDERNLYSITASAINKITPVHLSEWGFSKNDEVKLEKDRRADFQCLYKAKDNKTLNFFIEVKKGVYNLNKNSKRELTLDTQKNFLGLQRQLRTLKSINPEWEGKGAIYLGLMIIHSEYLEGEKYYTEEDIENNIKMLIDKRSNFQLLISNWHLPKGYDVQFEKYKCSFVSIIGLYLGQKSDLKNL